MWYHKNQINIKNLAVRPLGAVRLLSLRSAGYSGILVFNPKLET